MMPTPPAFGRLPISIRSSVPSSRADQCAWAIGNDNPGVTTNDFGRTSQYGQLLFLNYLRFGGGGTSRFIIDNYRQVLSGNPCPISTQGGDD